MDYSLTITHAELRESLHLTPARIRELCSDALVADVSALESKRGGVGVPFVELLKLAGIESEEGFVTLHSADGFSASLPVEIARRGFLIFELDDQPLPDQLGGPFRFFLVDSAECRTAEADHCANVKQIVRIDWSAERGPDTRD